MWDRCFQAARQQHSFRAKFRVFRIRIAGFGPRIVIRGVQGSRSEFRSQNQSVNPRRRLSKSNGPRVLHASCALLLWVALGRPASGQQPAFTPYTFTALAGAVGQYGDVDGPGGTARFQGPEGVAVDGAGNIYVADVFNNAIRKVTAGGVVSTLVGGAASLKNPEGVAVDSAGNVYVTDSSNNTIRKV